MRRVLLWVMVCALGGCQCVRLEDYRVCDATVDCGDAQPDASIEDAGTMASDGGPRDGGCVPDGLVDVLDTSGLDSDCDGVDGVMSRQLFVSGSQGNDTTAVPGSSSQPWATVGAALRFAASRDGGFDAVLVSSGAYDETEVEWTANVDVWGGRSGVGTWAPSGSMSNLRGGQVGLRILSVEGRTLRGFQVRSAEGPPSSIAVLVESASPHFVDVQLFAVAGGGGLAGGTEGDPNAEPGLPGTPGVSSGFTLNGGPSGVCGGEDGFAGGGAAKSQGTSGSAGEGPLGGVAGAPPSATCSMVSVQAGQGGDGDAGIDGAPGVSATAFGQLNDKRKWIGADGTLGSTGTPGKPGSGGGGGGAPNVAGSTSSSGGSGGSGGCPGARGAGGSSGGPSIGLVVINGRPVIGPDTFIIAGAGGPGGPGGPAGPGLPGGAGGSAGPLPAALECGSSFPYGRGGAGGSGGRGGNGGRGGGGAGGHSLGVYCELDGGFEMDGGVMMIGTPGPGADGARAGVAQLSYGCTP